MKEFLHDLRAQLDYIECNVRIHVMLLMHTERHSFNIYVNFTSKLGLFW